MKYTPSNSYIYTAFKSDTFHAPLRLLVFLISRRLTVGLTRAKFVVHQIDLKSARECFMDEALHLRHFPARVH